MARHRNGLRRVLDLKPKAYASFSAITHGRPALARALDFFPTFGSPIGMRVVHDDIVTSTMTAPRYADELLKLSQFNRESLQSSPHTPPYPQLRRVIWEAPEIYIPGRILAPVDRRSGLIASFEHKGPSNWSITRPRPIRDKPIRIVGPAILIPRMKHYGHLLTDILAPMVLAVQLGLISREKPVTVVRAEDDNAVSMAFAEGLLRMGVASKVLALGRSQSALADSYLHCETLASSGEHRFATPEITPLLCEIFRLAYADLPAPPTPRRVYLKRGDVKLRRVAGEDELISRLQTRGFEVFEANWENHPSQLATFAHCEILVGVHGAGLANVIFGRKDSRLVEIHATNARKTTGLYWASCAGMDYSSVFGGPEGERQSFTIDPDAVFEEIRHWLPEAN